MKTIVSLFSNWVESKVNLLQIVELTELTSVVLESLNEIEGHGEYLQICGKILQISELVVIQEQFFEMGVVTIVEEREILQIVVLQRYFAQSLEVSQIYWSDITVVGEDILTFGSWRENQSTTDILLENHYLLLKIVYLIQLLFCLCFLALVVYR